ncbi:Putative transcriptional regulator%2C TetR family [Mycobacteroides abscessus]|nr:Putative transcriptional regulator%2C TetR family [Mycobacteroides abscessus]
MDDENDTTARKRLPKGQGWQLRQQIIDTAMDLILSSGEARAPSARELTRALGITAPSLYRHFSSTDELADALCARYFEQLGEALQRATVNVSTALERLHALGLAYVRHAAEHPLGTASRRPILHASGQNRMKYSAAQPFCICGTSFKSSLTRSVFPAVIPSGRPCSCGRPPMAWPHCW